MNSPRLLISAAHKSSGKTTIALGLCAALRNVGLTVQPFKKGPDYIDPLWLTQAAARACYNLDFYTQSEEEIAALFAAHASSADLSMIEGNKGLHDGLALDGSNSNAALAALLDAPVLLVVDTQGTTRGIAPLLLGYQAFDQRVRIGGVILNKVGGPRHEAKLRQFVEHYTDIPVMGAVQRSDELTITERHLGLMPSNESGDAAAKIGHIARVVSAQVDLGAIRALANAARPLSRPAAAPVPSPTTAASVRVGIFRDRAFGFYYQDDLEALERLGAKLVFINGETDTRLPILDGLFIGGGFPEVMMKQLSANAALRAQVRSAIDAGLPTYAECGGLMYLARSISWRGQRCEMVGSIPGDVLMHERAQGRGYIRLEPTEHFPWPQVSGTSAHAEVRGHEFHHSSLENLPEDMSYAYRVVRGHGIDGRHDGVILKNLLAAYGHQRTAGGNQWTERFVAFIRQHATQRTSPPAPARVQGNA
ncbi:MAG: hydrogenase expression protein HypE [Gammaproteobacteria bacterium SG8_47]|nr:MAG: hydrogenase expression protein HypE [Gammaproteobacteria bacterium SG8_47]